MPRNGSGVYSPPAGTTAVTATAIDSSDYNDFVTDLTSDLNAARPISAGGTGATNAAAALVALGAQASSPFTGSATSYSPVVTASIGTLTSYTSVGEYRKVGKMVFVKLYIILDNAGTASGLLYAGLPFVISNFGQTLTCYSNSDGQLCSTLLVAGTDGVQVVLYNAGTVIVTGRALIITGWYEASS
jgi:hypothetical protein